MKTLGCPRCGGLMVRERFEDYLDGRVSFHGVRCIACGEILNPTILNVQFFFK